jgi:GWxTD domain-containing protein
MGTHTALIVTSQDEVIASKKLFFQRSNPGAKVVYSDMTAFNVQNTFAEKITNLDSLKEDISCTFPICSGIERSFIKGPLKQADLITLQQYFYGFWLRRDAKNPEKAWIAYAQQVKKAQANFGTPIKKGYQTDRGRVFLEYGPPNTRSTQYSEPSSYPYEIWQYYTLNNNQRNKKFVFYSPDMVTSDFLLLHSDATGEVHNPSWQMDLRSRMEQHVNLQDVVPTNSWGDFSKDYWDLPN